MLRVIRKIIQTICNLGPHWVKELPADFEHPDHPFRYKCRICGGGFLGGRNVDSGW